MRDMHLVKMEEILDDRYQLERLLGEGGSGKVYLAYDRKLEKWWAVKFLVMSDSTKACEAEIAVLKSSRCPGVPRIVDVVTRDSGIAIVMDYIPGISLEEMQKKEGNLQEEQLVRYAVEICTILQYFHSRNPPLIYQDLKPGNIMITAEDKVMMIDFGTVTSLRTEESDDAKGSEKAGTRGYAAPEQYSVETDIDERTDIYCLGAVMYYLLTGHYAEQEAVWGECLRNTGISEGLYRILEKCLRKDPEYRFQSVQELKKALEESGRFREQYKGEGQRQRILFLVLMISGVLFTLLSLTGRSLCLQTRKSLSEEYLKKAELSDGTEDREQFYRKALSLTPQNKNVYESMLKTYVEGGTYDTDDASLVTGLLETESDGESCLHILEKKNQAGYKDFCYRMGIGYFYNMGGDVGKREAGKWFEKYLEAEKDNRKQEKEEGREERAELYVKIAEYYETFLDREDYEAGEAEQMSYRDFYRLLHQLNQANLRQSSDRAEVKAVYLISREVLVEIANYAGYMLEEGDVSEKELMSEIQKITEHTKAKGGRWNMLSRRESRKNMNLLADLAADACSKVRIAADQKRRRDKNVAGDQYGETGETDYSVTVD